MMDTGMECWLRWSVGARVVALARPLALAVVEDIVAARPSGDGAPLDPALPRSVLTIVREAFRRVGFKRGEQAPAVDVPYGDGTLCSMLAERLVDGRCPDERPVDGASLQPLAPADFVVVSRCGAWKDARIERVFNARFGVGVWRAGYSWGEHTVDVRSGIELYEDGYRAALAADPELLAWVCGFAEVYDTAPSNIAAFCDYSVQEVEGAGQHWQDVAVRRALLRLGRWFTGRAQLEIRGRDSGGYRLNPGQLAFHRVDRIVEPRQYAWWDPDSIEDFSVSNFCVQAPLPAVRAWTRAGEIDEERLQTVLVAQHPGLWPELPRLSAAGLRARVVAARTLSLAGARAFFASHDDAALAEQTRRVEALPEQQRRTLDRLLAEDPLTRRDGLATLLASSDRAFVRWMLEVVTEDPARKMRARARAAIQALE